MTSFSANSFNNRCWVHGLFGSTVLASVLSNFGIFSISLLKVLGILLNFECIIRKTFYSEEEAEKNDENQERREFRRASIKKEECF